MATNIMKMT